MSVLNSSISMKTLKTMEKGEKYQETGNTVTHGRGWE